RGDALVTAGRPAAAPVTPPRGVDVACVGHPFLDLIFRGLARIPGPGEEELARELVVVPGAIANVAYALRRLGLEAVVCAPIPDDPAGRFLAELMADAGIPWLGRHGGAAPVSVALPAHGDRAFVTAAPPPAVDADAVRSVAPRAVVADLPNVPLLPELPSATAVYAVLGDPEVRVLAGNLPASLDHLRALILNEREARALTGEPDAAEAARALASLRTTVVVTRGPDGAVAFEPDGRTAAVPAPRVDVADATGAGDLFTAAYVWADLAGRCLDDRISIAVRYASASLAAAPVGRQKGLTRAELESGRGAAPTASPAADVAGQKEEERV
ncbi:MAG TPA: PfkB family carbohydrate kinase, partial [Candidatus Limnocylindrales bacterium]|nr:PfkB family carbohydrate kinase [Candidatus Limnocylindrales bacterium]